MSYTSEAISRVKECANSLEGLGHSFGILRDLEATGASKWLLDMATEMRKACEEDIGIPGWHAWLDDLLRRYGFAEQPFENTTEADLAMRRLVEVAYKDLKDELDSISVATGWEHWALELMDQYEVCDKSALTEPFDVDEAQEALATCFKDYEVRIEQLQARIKELESTAGPAFTADKE